MATILDALAAHGKERVQAARAKVPQQVLEKQCAELGRGELLFEKALACPELAFICECKKASPSKGVIAPDFPYLKIAQEYATAGADAISVLTEPQWFLGADKYLHEIVQNVAIPCLRKDFLVDEYMIYEARVLGASAILLICTILDPVQLHDYQQLADELGLSALVEAHNPAEVEQALSANARIIGVNNRNLKDFTVDANNCANLRELVPPEVLFVAESGIMQAADVRAAAEIGADAVLVGEALMRAADKKATLAAFKNAAKLEAR